MALIKAFTLTLSVLFVLFAMMMSPELVEASRDPARTLVPYSKWIFLALSVLVPLLAWGNLIRVIHKIFRENPATDDRDWD